MKLDQKAYSRNCASFEKFLILRKVKAKTLGDRFSKFDSSIRRTYVRINRLFQMLEASCRPISDRRRLSRRYYVDTERTQLIVVFLGLIY